VTGAEFEGVDLDLLADYVGGALTGTSDEERVAALVATDPAWRAAHELLEPGMSAVGADLRALGPEPMPDDLAARLDSLLREPGGAEPVPAKVVDLAKARRMRRWVAPIAVAAATVAFAGFGISQVAPLSSMNSTDSAASGAGSKGGIAPMVAAAPPPEAVLRTGTDYTGATLTSAGTGGTETAQTLGGGVPSTAAGSSDVGGAERSGRLDALGDTNVLAACLEAIAQENGGGAIVVELVDYARFEGTPALIVRFSAANGIWVWAVGPGCGTPGTGADPVEQLPVR
jgi:hypothetical protein